MPRDRRTGSGTDQRARERLLDAAYDLFSARGVRDVGVEEVIARAGVAKATLYNNFNSKDELVLAFLERRQQRWTHEWLEAQAMSRGTSPRARLLAMFDLFDEWFHRDDFEGCAFINTLLEMGKTHPTGRASINHLENIRIVVRDLAKQAGVRSPTDFARSWLILMKGSIIAAAEGDLNAARRAKSMARLLLTEHQ